MAELSPIEWALRPLKKYAVFSGRAPRAELWWYLLFLIIAVVLGLIVESILGLPKLFFIYGPLTLLIALGTFVPSLAVQVRRLHDRNYSGWWLAAFWLLEILLQIFGPLGPVAGKFPILAGALALSVFAVSITLIVFWARPGTPSDNRYGPNPYGKTTHGAGPRVTES